VFLFEDMVSHLLAQTFWSNWQWCDSPRQLAEVLLNITLPDIASWWFDAASFGEPRRMPLPATVEAAAKSDEDDRTFFLDIARDLETLDAGPDPVDFAKISDVLDRFTTRFGNTSKWDFTLQAFPSAVAAGGALHERQGELTDPSTGEDFTEAEWLDLCARSGTDPAASEVVTAVFEDAYMR
jgi:hypothetical protein